MKYAVSEEGVSALHAASNSIQNALESIEGLTGRIRSASGEHSGVIGPHEASLEEALEQIEQNIKTASGPAEEVAEKLDDVADGYEEVIGNDPYSKQGGDATQTNSVAANQSRGGSGVGGASASSGALQTSHREFIGNYEQQVSSVQADVLEGSGWNITKEAAKSMLYGVQRFSGTGYKTVREAYNNPQADPKSRAVMQAVDAYISSAPKWKGEVFRGIHVSKETAESIVSGETVDMLGPSSWSSDRSVAERFSRGYNDNDVSIIFELGDNKSGASITHIASWNGVEKEVTAPSGVQYHIDEVSRTVKDKIETIVIKVHE